MAEKPTEAEAAEATQSGAERRGFVSHGTSSPASDTGSGDPADERRNLNPSKSNVYREESPPPPSEGPAGITVSDDGGEGQHQGIKK